jgi:hypothetical protein
METLGTFTLNTKKKFYIPKVQVHVESSCPLALKIAEHGLVGKFMGICPSLRTVSECVDKKWNPLIQGNVSPSFCGKGFFSISFLDQIRQRSHIQEKPLLYGGSGPVS